METQNITLTLRKDILRKAKHLAIERQATLYGLITQALEELVTQNDTYELAWRSHLTLLEHGFDLSTGGYAPCTREKLHER